MSVTNSGDGPASVSRRMMYRAEKYLLDSKSRIGKRFALYLDTERTQWNESHHRWQVLGSGVPPEDISPQPGGCYYPPLLWRDFRSTAKEQRDSHGAATGMMLIEDQAVTDWWEITDRIANYWWPANDFPIERFGAGHPAQFFISVCLCFNHLMVPCEWIGKSQLKLHWVSRQPNLLEKVLVDTLLALERHAGVVGGQRVGPNLGLPPEMLESAIRGIRDRLSIPPNYSPWTLRHSPVHPEPDDYLFVPIPHSVTREAIEDAASQIAKDAQSTRSQNFVTQRAWELHEKGATPYEIAIRLGVNQKTVQGWLDGAEFS